MKIPKTGLIRNTLLALYEIAVAFGRSLIARIPYSQKGGVDVGPKETKDKL